MAVFLPIDTKNEKGFYLRKEIEMKVENTTYYETLEALELWKERLNQQSAQTSSDEQTDSFLQSVSSQSTEIPPIPTGTYNASGFEENYLNEEKKPGAMPPPPKPEETEETEETDETTETTATSSISTTGYEDLLAQLSDTFRASPESILMTMESLGLSMEDLSDEENLTSLATAMSEGASSMGLPSAGNVEDLISSLSDYIAERNATVTTV